MSDPDLEERTKFEPSNCQVIAPDEMPELKRVQDLVREIHKDSQVKQMLGRCTRYHFSPSLALRSHFRCILSLT